MLLVLGAKTPLRATRIHPFTLQTHSSPPHCKTQALAHRKKNHRSLTRAFENRSEGARALT